MRYDTAAMAHSLNLSQVSSSTLPDALAEAFPHSRAETRRTLGMVSVIRTFEPGEVIIRQGDASSLSLVLDGHVAVRRTTAEGRQFIVRLVTTGRLSPVLPFAARPASADAVALTPSVVAIWRSRDLRSLAMSDPGLAVDVLDDVLGSLDEVVGRLDSLLYQDALRRVARVLHRHADLFFAEPPALARAQLPHLVGTSREMTGRVIRVLEAKRVVARVGRQRLRLLDPDGLAAIANQTRPEPAQAGVRAATRSSRSRPNSRSTST